MFVTSLRCASVALMVLLAGCGKDDQASMPQVAAGEPLLADHPFAELFQRRCASCHGTNAIGNVATGAPALGSLQDWYLQRQLQNFRDGVRGRVEDGAELDDPRAVAMSQAVAELIDIELEGLVSYLAELPAIQPPTPKKANLARGKDYHMNLCSACHGTDARGNQVLQAPSLVGLNAEYLTGQYAKFLNGQRGVHERDTYGAQMRRLAPAVADPEVVEDIAAYLTTLSVAID